MREVVEASVAKQVARRAQAWALAAGSTLKIRERISPTMLAVRDGKRTAEQQTLLAAACELFDLLYSTPDGRQALLEQRMLPRCVLFVAPQGSGKTLMAPALMEVLGLTTLVDEFLESTWPTSVPDGALVLSSHMPTGVPAHVRVISLDEAKALVSPGSPEAGEEKHRIENCTPDRTTLVLSRGDGFIKITAIGRHMAAGSGGGEGCFLPGDKHNAKNISGRGCDDEAR